MPIFKSVKEKRRFWVYLIVSFLVFLISAWHQELKYRDTPETGGDVFQGMGFAVLAILIPLTYLIIFSTLIVRYRIHKTHKERYKSFHDISENEQKEFLQKAFCPSCNEYDTSIYKSEAMIDGMRWLNLECKECGTPSKLRVS